MVSFLANCIVVRPVKRNLAEGEYYAKVIQRLK